MQWPRLEWQPCRFTSPKSLLLILFARLSERRSERARSVVGEKDQGGKKEKQFDSCYQSEKKLVDLFMIMVDALPAYNIFDEVDSVYNAKCLDSRTTLEEDWQQVTFIVTSRLDLDIKSCNIGPQIQQGQQQKQKKVGQMGKKVSQYCCHSLNTGLFFVFKGRFRFQRIPDISHSVGTSSNFYNLLALKAKNLLN